jgi:hypothetical protein
VDTTQRIKAATATLMVGFLLAIAFAATAQAKPGPAEGVTARANAINQHYRLGLYGAVAPAKLDQLRAQAINNFYGIGSSNAAAVQKADEARAQATNTFYNLRTSNAAAVQKADEARAQATNTFYNLGTSNPAVVQKADAARAQAMNRFYNVGNSSVGSTSSGFGWGDAGIGVGGMVGLILLAAGLTVVLRHRSDSQPSSPSTI